MNKFKIRIKNYADKPSGFWLDSIKDGKCIVTDNEEKATLFVDDTLDDLSVYDHLRVLETKHGYVGEAVLIIDEPTLYVEGEQSNKYNILLGRKTVEYLQQFEGTGVYNDIAKAIQFGFHLDEEITHEMGLEVEEDIKSRETDMEHLKDGQTDYGFLKLLKDIKNHVESLGDYITSPRIKFETINKEGFQIMGDNGNGATRILYRLTIEKF